MNYFCSSCLELSRSILKAAGWNQYGLSGANTFQVMEDGKPMGLAEFWIRGEESMTIPIQLEK